MSHALLYIQIFYLYTYPYHNAVDIYNNVLVLILKYMADFLRVHRCLISGYGIYTGDLISF